MKAIDYCFRVLSIKPYSTKKLSQKLKEKGFEENDINQALERLVELGYLNDIEFSKSYIRSQVKRNVGNKVIIFKGRDQGVNIDNEIIEAVRAELNFTEVEAIENLLNKKRYNKTDASRKDKDKIFRYLMSKGHSYENIKCLI